MTPYKNLYEVVKHRPGLRQADVAKVLGVARCSVHRALAKNHGGKLLMETAKLLWPMEYRPQTVADYLVFGMALPPLEKPPANVEGHCVLTGISVEVGYRAMDIVPNAAGEFLDLLPGGVGGYLSENAARALRGTWNLGSRVIFEDGTHYHPLIARDPKHPERPIWSDLVRELWPARRGENVLVILTTDAKKRIWPRARIGAIGETTPVLIYDVTGFGLSSVQMIGWPVLLETLAPVETIYSMGFTKHSIRYSLLRQWKLAQEIGIGEAMRLDRQLKPLREEPEFAMAVIIARKKEAEK